MDTMMPLIKVLVLLTILVNPVLSMAATIWCNPANTGTEDGVAKSTGYNTLWEAVAAMNGGDTVIIADGDWQAIAGMSLVFGHAPPSGTAEAYTRIIAETDWGARIHHIYIDGSPRSYVEVRGIVFDSLVTPTANVVYDWSYCKFIRCGFLMGKITGNNHNGFGSSLSNRSGNHHNLMEECIAWGGGRYMLYSKYGQYNIFRRCVVRHDNQESSGDQNDGQISNFRGYGVDYHYYQNCISIDSDRVSNYNGGVLNSEASGFWTGDSYGSTGIVISGSISIKDVQMPFYLGGKSISPGITHVDNSVALSPTPGVASTLSAFYLRNGQNVIASKILGIDATGTGQDGLYGKNAGTFTSSDVILRDVYDIGMPSSVATYASYVNRYNTPTGSYGTNSTNTDPFLNGLLYPVRIEAGSALATAGTGGSVLGPTILKKIGVSGTLYGDAGWNTETNDDLWPFPNEDIIKTLMSTTVDGVSGAYGFTTGTSISGSAQTLTKYIWEQFGNQIPADVYGEASCNIYHLNLCNVGNCAGAGGNWCTDVCQLEACTPTCEDMLKNGDESGVDCGGLCPDTCLPPPSITRTTWGGGPILSIQTAE